MSFPVNIVKSLKLIIDMAKGKQGENVKEEGLCVVANLGLPKDRSELGPFVDRLARERD